LRRAPTPTPTATITTKPSSPAAAPSRPKVAWQFPEGSGGHDDRTGTVRELLSLFPPGRLLDLGCGPGIFARLADGLGWQVTAVDARTERMPMTPGITWIRQDVRDADVSGYDAILMLGLLYHLELDDQLALLRRCSGTVTILDTHHSNAPTHQEGGYAGHTFTELPPEQEAALASTPTAAWGNMTAFWPTQPDLVRMLTDCGYATVLTRVPPTMPDRTFYLCLPGRRSDGAKPPAS
jgi:hypothetical protein